MTPEELQAANDLAHIIMGEAGSLCGPLAMIAVAHVYSRNPLMYGYAEPDQTALMVALYWSYLPDPTRGARYLVSQEDLTQPRVRAYTLDRGPPVAIFRCRRGLKLYAFM